jgi:hypothetical protein
MPGHVVEVKDSQVKIELTVELSCSMLETEEAIQVALNEAGCLASREALRYFDTDGSAIQIGPEIWRTKGQQPKIYQTPYGEVELERHVYQRSGGGATYCPLEREARIIITSTPRFAKQVSSTFAQGAAGSGRKPRAVGGGVVFAAPERGHWHGGTGQGNRVGVCPARA